jgi:hypothetical protein
VFAIRRLVAVTAGVVAAVSLLAAPVAAHGAIVANGDFETGSLSGWQVENETPGSGSWFPYTGTLSPLGFATVPAPPQGNFAAITDQDNPGRHLLYQDLTLPPGGTQSQLSLLVYYPNSPAFAAPNSLDPAVFPNQQYRIDVMKQSAPLTSVDPADILLTVFQTKPADPTTLAATQKFADLAPFAGQTVRLRFAEVDNQGPFHAGTDAVAINSNGFTIGKPKLNKKQGTATLSLNLPDPGDLTTSGKGVKAASAPGARISKSVGAGKVKLKVRATGKKKNSLNRTGKVKLKVAITYTPNGLSTNTRSVKVKLKKNI